MDTDHSRELLPVRVITCAVTEGTLGTCKQIIKISSRGVLSYYHNKIKTREKNARVCGMGLSSIFSTET